ncbi:DUF2802 domain-containing protein [Thioalkalivibrio sp. ALJ24]|uniref:DUF2802 domain-containing protein n=1 Tax=Thioalkalivibrio sp. ALJ24 TaxID=545276 RepID=UPI000376BA06|nr:DUF2802 domain-containing protein [Thioalkalivibrio sp. ALJ24]
MGENILVWVVAGIALISTIVAAFAIAMVLLLRRQLAALRQDYQRQATSLMALQGAMKVLSEGVINHGQAQAAVQRALERLHDQHTELRARDPDQGSYEKAIQLVREGYSRDEVRRLCSLTPTELDLIYSLHGAGTARGGE